MKIEFKDVEISLSPEDWEDVVDTAGYGIAYWVERAVVDSENLTYRIEWFDGDDLNSQIITLADIEKAWGKIVSGHIQVNSDIRSYLSSGDLGDVDADAADVLIQVALFGEIIYG